MKSWLTDDMNSFAPGRIDSFLAGRFCACKAFEKYDVVLDGLEVDVNGAPLWPVGTGSISHTKNAAIAAVSTQFRSIGIDIEVEMSNERAGRVTSSFIRPSEEQFIEGGNTFNSTLIFSAKESLYKMINPLCHEYFGFQDAYLTEIGEKDFLIALDSERRNVREFNKTYRGQFFKLGGNIVTILTL